MNEEMEEKYLFVGFAPPKWHLVALGLAEGSQQLWFWVFGWIEIKDDNQNRTKYAQRNGTNEGNKETKEKYVGLIQ